jgi:hypothetical protein
MDMEYFKGKGGRAIYGVVVGIISNETAYPRVPGDSGNASTYPFPTIIKTVRQSPSFGSIPERVVKRDPRLLEEYITLIREFEKAGARAVTTTCGFNVVFQENLCKVAKIPVFTSSLLQLPLVQKMLPEGKEIGIITANSEIFNEYKKDLLSCAGLDPSTPIIIEGMEKIEGWHKPFLDQEKIEKEIAQVAAKMVSDNSDIGAIVFECHNLPPYGKAVQDATGLPVFDIITLVDLAYGATTRKRYTGVM